MNKRKFTKFLVSTITTGVAARVITKTIAVFFPTAEDHLLTDVTGAVGGWYIGEKLQPHTDAMIDEFFDKRENSLSA